MAALGILYSAELVGLVGAVTIVGTGRHERLDRGAMVLEVVLVAAAAMTGWHAIRLLQGARVMKVTGMALQSAILITAIAVATVRPIIGVPAVIVAAGVLAGWGRLSRLGRPLAIADRPTRAVSAATPPSVEVGAPGGVRPGGIALVLVTSLLVLVALSVRSEMAVKLAILATIFIPLERLFALHPRQVLRRGWRTDVVHYLVNGAARKVGLVGAVAVAGTALQALVPATFRAAVVGNPGWLQVVAALAITAVGGYAGHRAMHEVPVLWRFHRVHHSVREMDWLAAAHMHPLDQIAIRSAAVVPLYALGFGRVGLGAIVILLTLQDIFIHANLRLTCRPLSWLIATPQFHHWHHARQPQAYNSNYAAEFPLVDALFGTLYLPADRWPAEYGIDDDQPDGYVRQLVWPLR
ncbi:hypothetical protein LAUMK191_01871 [Mycobacterium attenuatum]|uniref:Fatty acid hydroxylase domain-containing protein n=1 Tax=Mycobacterium attenuatum TaxID=2341086 RepID=A0A498PYN2_9MYCO|nr:hypothetical protein LAUMK136_01879 [Mycobacterium attenuatum]VBA50355.1 hypothetical protein LAUMK191_01871 [Mycobacterium attenuatum]VBA56080.1 hypothetical protein LAUMK41_01945 [Mycobacterium attenuatum]